jgi:hypothetical protein
MTTAIVIALIVSHGLCLALGAWGHYLYGHALKYGGAMPISTDVRASPKGPASRNIP